MSLVQYTYDDAERLVDALNLKIQTDLNQAIEQNGQATLAVSGGNTPKPLFAKLASNKVIDWSNVTVMLVDERWVSDDAEASNQRLVKQHLLTAYAAKANYLLINKTAPTIEDAIAQFSPEVKQYLPLDVVVLGMGNDGHTASLFPCSEELAHGLNLNNEAVVLSTTPTTAPHKRISLTLRNIVTAKNVYLHITGAEKKDILLDAVEHRTEMEKPIAAVAKHAELQLVWAP